MCISAAYITGLFRESGNFIVKIKVINYCTKCALIKMVCSWGLIVKLVDVIKSQQC